MRIEKKTWPDYFQKILDGEKTFDVRIADFECNPGDILVLKEWDPQNHTYTGRVIEREVTYVAKLNNLSFWSKEDVKKYGLQIMALK